MSVKKNPKTKTLPFKSGDRFTRLGSQDRGSKLQSSTLFEYEPTDDPEIHLLKEIKGGGVISHPFSVDQTALLSEYRVQPERLIKSKLSLDLTPLLGCRVELKKFDGCHATGELIAISVNSVQIGENQAVVPVLLHVSGVGEIPVAEVSSIEVRS